jgi:hypothetical protein
LPPSSCQQTSGTVNSQGKALTGRGAPRARSPASTSPPFLRPSASAGPRPPALQPLPPQTRSDMGRAAASAVAFAVLAWAAAASAPVGLGTRAAVGRRSAAEREGAHSVGAAQPWGILHPNRQHSSCRRPDPPLSPPHSLTRPARPRPALPPLAERPPLPPGAMLVPLKDLIATSEPGSPLRATQQPACAHGRQQPSRARLAWAQLLLTTRPQSPHRCERAPHHSPSPPACPSLSAHRGPQRKCDSGLPCHHAVGWPAGRRPPPAEWG